MIAFITSVRHPRNSADYDRVCRLLDDSLRSVCRQENPDFSIWVVGNSRPASLPQRAHWLQVPFSPPTEREGPITGRDAVLLDKGSKLAAGFLAAAETAPDHVMFFDADDLVSRRLSGLSAESPESPGWRITQGWRWSAERRSIRRQAHFHRHCGTAFIINRKLLPRPPFVTADSEQGEIVEAFGPDLVRVFGSHLYLSDDLKNRGRLLAPVPFAGALYRVGTGENHSGVSMGGLGRPVSRAIAKEFGIASTPIAPAALVRAILPSKEAFWARIPGAHRSGDRSF